MVQFLIYNILVLMASLIDYISIYGLLYKYIYILFFPPYHIKNYIFISFFPYPYPNIQDQDQENCLTRPYFTSI